MRWFLGKTYMWLSGWRMKSKAPDAQRFVMIAAPHTSNWDLPAMLAMAWILGLRLHWLGKKQLFRWPLGWFMRAVGGVSIDRSAPQGTVAQVAQAFRDQSEFVLAIPAEGTRGRADRWKSGFYHIAKRAEVPIVLGRLDWNDHVATLSDPIWPSDDVRADMDKIRAYYDGVGAKCPENYGPVRIKEEDAE